MRQRDLNARLTRVIATLEKTALDPHGQRARSIPAADRVIETIQSALDKLPEEMMTTRQWKWWNEIQNKYKVNFIPMLTNYLAGEGLNPNDKSNTVFRDLSRLQVILENSDIVQDKLAPDKNRIKTARELQEFLKRLAISTSAPLRDVVEKLNGLDFRSDADKVQKFIRDAQAISDTLERVIVQQG